MKKRIIAIILCAMLVMTAFMTACGNKNEESKEVSSEAPVEESSEAPVEESSEAPVEESSEAAVEESSEAPVEESSEEPVEESSEAPVEESSEEPEETEEPAGYLWLTGVGDEAVDPGIHFKVPGSLIKDAPVTVKALVKFSEDCQSNDGCVFLNFYSYAQDEISDFTYLVTYLDYAKDSEVEKGKWVEIDTSEKWPNLNPHDGTYGSYKGKKVDPAIVTLGIGFYLASGTIQVGYISLEQDGEEIWGIDFSEGFDVDDSDDLSDIASISNMTAETKDVTWGCVAAIVDVPED